MGLIRRLRGTLGGWDSKDTFAEEARFHLDQRIDEYIRQGMTPDEAEHEARRRMGNLTLAGEQVRDANRLPWLHDMSQDLRYASRQLRRNPGFAVTAVLTLAIGIGVVTALFSTIDKLLLEQLPVRAPDELVLFNWLEGRKQMRFGMDGLRTTDEDTGRGTSTSFSYLTFLRLRQANRTLTDLFAFYPIQQLNVVTDGGAEIASGQYISGNYFQGLGVNALLGRTITADDDRSGASPVATITYEYWQRRFGSNPRVVGGNILVNKVAFTIVGVTPEGFAGTLGVTSSPDITLPFAAEPLLQGEASDVHRPAFLWVQLMGRLKPDVSRDQAAANLNAAMQDSMLDEWRQALATRGGDTTGDVIRTMDDASTLRAEPGGQGLMGARRRYARPLLMLMACAALVLLAACVNVANLLLVRAFARQREITLRVALGAGQGRLLRQLFTESMLIAVAGSAVGLALAFWGADLLHIWQPWGGGTLLLNQTINWRVLAFCGAAAIVTGLLFGVAPALRATQGTLSQVTKRAADGSSGRLAKVLVVAQVAIAVVLLVAAGLFVSTMRNLRAVDMGFNPERLLLFRVQPQLNGYDPSEIAALYSGIIDRIESIPGVRSATLSRHPLLSFSRRADSISVEGVSASGESGAEINIVAPNFFQVMEIPLVLGRRFDERDSAAAPKVAVVNQLFAARYFVGGNPIGRRLWFGDSMGTDALEIVGMTRDAKYTDLRNPTQPVVYLPMQQDVPGQANFAVRTAGDPLELVPAVRRAVAELDPTLPLFDVKSQIGQAQESVQRERMFARLSTMLGCVSLALAAIGLYGTMSCAVVRRTSEIGIRMALGAERSTITRMVLRDALVLATIGVAIGIPSALGASRVSRSVLEQVLFGVEPNDPFTLVAVAGLLVLVVMVAGLLPARKASRVEPIVALQCE